MAFATLFRPKPWKPVSDLVEISRFPDCFGGVSQLLLTMMTGTLYYTYRNTDNENQYSRTLLVLNAVDGTIVR